MDHHTAWRGKNCVKFSYLEGENVNTISALLLSEHVWWEILDGRFVAVDGKVIIIASSSRFAARSVGCLTVIVLDANIERKKSSNQFFLLKVPPPHFVISRNTRDWLI